MQSRIIPSTVASFLLLVPLAEVSAEPVTFEISATVYNIYDPGNAFQNIVVSGDKITGTYTIDISTPDSEPDPQYGHYLFDPTSTQLGFDFLLNGISLKSDPMTSSHMYEAHTMNSSADHFGIISHGNMPLSNGARVDDIFIDLYDPTGQALTTDALVGQAPNVSTFEFHDIHVSGTTGTENYYLDAAIDSIQAVGGQGQCSSGSSNIVTFNVSATVREIYDYDNALGNAINVGDKLSGSYTFNTNTPDSDPTPEYGFYEHTPGSGTYGFNIDIANTNLKTNTSTDRFNIIIGNANGNITWDTYGVDTFGTQLPFVNNTVVENMGMYIEDPSGNIVTGTNLTDQPPALSSTGYKDFYIGGMSIVTSYSSYFSIVATVDSISPVCEEPNDLVVVSPASGIFDVMQHFDAAVVMDAGLPPLVGMQGTNNGIDITPELSNCFPGTPNGQNRQTYICPNFSNLLMPGDNRFTFTFHLNDGSTLNHSVNWQLLGY